MRVTHINCSSGTTKWLLATIAALMATAVVVAGAGAPPAGATASSAFVPAPLLAKAQESPSAVFKVIVQGSGQGNGVAASIRSARLADPGVAVGLKRQLATIDGASPS